MSTSDVFDRGLGSLQSSGRKEDIVSALMRRSQSLYCFEANTGSSAGDKDNSLINSHFCVLYFSLKKLSMV